MGTSYNPKIVTGGLILCLDAANTKSYPGSGTVWSDISGNGNDATMYSATHVPGTAGGTMQTTGVVTSYIDIPLILTTGTSTIIVASRYRPAATVKGRILNATSNNWLLGHHGGTSPDYYSEGWVSNGLTTTNSSVWQMYTGTVDTVGDKYSFYVNGGAVVTDSALGAAGPNGLTIGKYNPGASEFSESEVSFVMAYNRVLTAAEVAQNFRATKGRFGL